VEGSLDRLVSDADKNESDSDDDESDSDDPEKEDTDLSGMKCRAPYTHSWGEMSFHNAIILSVLFDTAEVGVDLTRSVFLSRVCC